MLQKRCAGARLAWNGVGDRAAPERVALWPQGAGADTEPSVKFIGLGVRGASAVSRLMGERLHAETVPHVQLLFAHPEVAHPPKFASTQRMSN